MQAAMCLVRVKDHIADSLGGRTGSTLGSVFSVSACLNTVQLVTYVRASSGVLCFMSCYKDPKGCPWQKIRREHQDPAVAAFSNSVSSDCN